MKYCVSRIFTKAQGGRRLVLAQPAFPAAAALPGVLWQRSAACTAVRRRLPCRRARRFPRFAAPSTPRRHAEAAIHMKVSNIFCGRWGCRRNSMTRDGESAACGERGLLRSSRAAGGQNSRLRRRAPRLRALRSRRPAIAARPAGSAAAAAKANNKVGWRRLIDRSGHAGLAGPPTSKSPT